MERFTRGLLQGILGMPIPEFTAQYENYTVDENGDSHLKELPEYVTERIKYPFNLLFFTLLIAPKIYKMGGDNEMTEDERIDTFIKIANRDDAFEIIECIVANSRFTLYCPPKAIKVNKFKVIFENYFKLGKTHGEVMNIKGIYDYSRYLYDVVKYFKSSMEALSRINPGENGEMFAPFEDWRFKSLRGYVRYMQFVNCEERYVRLNDYMETMRNHKTRMVGFNYENPSMHYPYNVIFEIQTTEYIKKCDGLNVKSIDPEDYDIDGDLYFATLHRSDTLDIVECILSKIDFRDYDKAIVNAFYKELKTRIKTYDAVKDMKGPDVNDRYKIIREAIYCVGMDLFKRNTVDGKILPFNEWDTNIPQYKMPRFYNN